MIPNRKNRTLIQGKNHNLIQERIQTLIQRKNLDLEAKAVKAEGKSLERDQKVAANRNVQQKLKFRAFIKISAILMVCASMEQCCAVTQ